MLLRLDISVSMEFVIYLTTHTLIEKNDCVRFQINGLYI